MQNEREFRIKISYTNDQSGARAAEQGIERIKGKTRDTGREGERAAGSMRNLNKAASQLQGAGAALTLSFGAVTAGMLMTARNYVQNVGTSESASRRWLGATKEIEQAQLRVGRVIAEQAAPYMEKLADLASNVAEFVEKHPEVVQAALLVGGSLAAIGTLLMTAGTVLKGIEAVGGLAKLAGLGGAGGAAAGGGGIGAAMSGILPYAAGAGGAFIGAGIYDAIRPEGSLNAGQTLTGAKGVVLEGLEGLWAAITGGDARAVMDQRRKQTEKEMLELGGVIEDVGDSAEEASDKTKELDFTSEQIAAYLAYTRQNQQAERAYQITISRMTRDYHRQQVIEAQDFNIQKMRSERDFARQESLAEKDYYRARLIRSRDFGIQVAREEQDHQKSVLRSKEDHEWRLRRIIMEGDGLAYWEENRQYEIDRRRGEEDYSIQASRRNEDFGREMRDKEREFAIERERRGEEFKIQQQDAAKDFEIRRKRNAEQFKLQLLDQEIQYQEERVRRQQALIDNMRDLYGALERERIMRQEFTKAMLGDLQAAIDDAGKGTNLIQGSRSSGGYVGAGLYRMHPNEYVLDAGTTAAVEQIAGRSLTQDTVLAMLSGNGGASSRPASPVQFVFNGRYTAEERAQIKNDMYQALEAAYDS